MTLAVECCHTILESDLAAWGLFLRKVLPWEKRVKLFLEALSQGQCIQDLSRTTGDRAPRLAPFALESLTCGFGTLEVWWMLAQEGWTVWTVWSSPGRQDVEDRGQDRPRSDLPPGSLAWIVRALWTSCRFSMVNVRVSKSLYFKVHFHPPFSFVKQGISYTEENIQILGIQVEKFLSLKF